MRGNVLSLTSTQITVTRYGGCSLGIFRWDPLVTLHPEPLGGTMQLVDHDSFLKQLTALFESTKEQGTIWLTHKRLTHDGDDAAMKFEEGFSDAREYPCLVRATDGKSAKFSTRVDSKQLPKFHAFYGSLLKASMTSLRKRDKKRDKQRVEQAAKRKKQMTEPIVLDGSKRGSGRRQRQRKIKALLKQQESQKKFREREEERKKAESKVVV